jgi:APA family basic amino acid/polyamine antiporter
VILSTLGTTNANVLSVARVTFAMGQQHPWFAWAGKVQPKHQTPGNALWLNAIWATILVISGSFDMLTDMLIFVTWFFYGMSALGVFILRRKYPDAERPYKVWGYPVITFLFVVFTAFFLISTLFNDVTKYIDGRTPIVNSFLGLCITCIGIPMYYLKRPGPKRKKR